MPAYMKISTTFKANFHDTSLLNIHYYVFIIAVWRLPPRPPLPIVLRHIWLELLGPELRMQLKGSGPRM